MKNTIIVISILLVVAVVIALVVKMKKDSTPVTNNSSSNSGATQAHNSVPHLPPTNNIPDTIAAPKPVPQDAGYGYFGTT